MFWLFSPEGGHAVNLNQLAAIKVEKRGGVAGAPVYAVVGYTASGERFTVAGGWPDRSVAVAALVKVVQSQPLWDRGWSRGLNG